MLIFNYFNGSSSMESSLSHSKMGVTKKNDNNDFYDVIGEKGQCKLHGIVMMIRAVRHCEEDFCFVSFNGKSPVADLPAPPSLVENSTTFLNPSLR